MVRHHHNPRSRDDPAAGTFRAGHLRLSLENAVRGGHDTDTVAAIAGGLLGARWGASAVPAGWRLPLHGWPASTPHDLVDLASRILRGGEPDAFDFSYSDREFRQPVVPHPYDDGLLLGDLSALRDLPAKVDAVVSLCRVGPQDAPDVAEWVEVRVIDHNGAEHNPHLDFVLHDTVTTLERLRSDGRTVLLTASKPAAAPPPSPPCTACAAAPSRSAWLSMQPGEHRCERSARQDRLPSLPEWGAAEGYAVEFRY